jgi:quercetin dioxygenase-like cupin family protein
MKIEKIEKPWGYEEIWAKTDFYVGKIIVINPGHRLSKQYHVEKTETVYVLEGTLLNYDKDDKVSTFTKGQSFHVEKNQVHRFGAPQDRYVKIVEVSTCQIDDVVRIEDDYGR